MTREYRKLFEKVFHECDSLSELLLKFDVYHINYPDELWPRMKYISSILETFKHSSALENDFTAWAIANADKVTTVQRASQWLSNTFDGRHNSKLNFTLLKDWISKNGLKLEAAVGKKRKRRNHKKMRKQHL